RRRTGPRERPGAAPTVQLINVYAWPQHCRPVGALSEFSHAQSVGAGAGTRDRGGVSRPVRTGPRGAPPRGGAGDRKDDSLARGRCSRRSADVSGLGVSPGGGDGSLSFAGLGDLLGGVDLELFAGLPTPQRRGLDAALLRDGGEASAPDRRAVFAGALS